MKILRRYQLDIIFLFFALLVFVGLAFYGLQQIGVDPHDYEWQVVGPILAIYLAMLWNIRSKISIHDRRKMIGRTLVYWILIGITLIASYQTPISAEDYWSINLFFIIFTLLLADSYWDFKALKLKNIINKKRIEQA